MLSPENAFLGDGEGQVFDVLVKTLPLALTVAMFTFLLLRRWRPSGMLGLYVAIGVILGVATLTQQWNLHSRATSVAFSSPFGAARASLNESNLQRSHYR